MIKYQRYIDLIDQVLQEMNPEDPYAGQCYVASAALKKLVGRELVLYRTRDHQERFHWWLETKDGQVIDLTSKQYTEHGHPVPSDEPMNQNKEKRSYMSFDSYRKRVDVVLERMNELDPSISSN